MNLELKDKVVILTGGTGGIGSHITLDFLKENAQIILLYRNESKWLKLKEWLKEEGCNLDNLHGIKGSITDVANVKKIVKDVMKQFGRIDVLVNCAGYSVEAPFLMLEEDDIDNMIDLNFKSPLYLMKAVLRPMIKQKSGNVINVSSVSTHAWGRGITVYAGAKAALERLTKTVAQEVGKKGIRINVVCPGVIDTNMSINLRSVANDTIMESTALRKYGQSKEVSKAVLFLASDVMSSFITGHVLKVDGGMNL